MTGGRAHDEVISIHRCGPFNVLARDFTQDHLDYIILKQQLYETEANFSKPVLNLLSTLLNSSKSFQFSEEWTFDTFDRQFSLEPLMRSYQTFALRADREAIKAADINVPGLDHLREVQIQTVQPPKDGASASADDGHSGVGSSAGGALVLEAWRIMPCTWISIMGVTAEDNLVAARKRAHDEVEWEGSRWITMDNLAPRARPWP